MSEFPDFKMPIEDRNAADFWLKEWRERFHETNDHAFIEAAKDMARYIDNNFEVEDE